MKLPLKIQLHKKRSALIYFRQQARRQRVLTNRINGQLIRSTSSSHQQVAVPDVTPCSPSKPMATPLDSDCALSTEELRELGRLTAFLPPSLRISNPRTNPARLILNASQYITLLYSTILTDFPPNGMARKRRDNKTA